MSISYSERLEEEAFRRQWDRLATRTTTPWQRRLLVIGLYKTEIIHRLGPWKGMGPVEYETLKWVNWFNHHRLMEPIGDMPPVELEMAYDRQIGESALAA